MEILLTGAAGFMAGHLLPALRGDAALFLQTARREEAEKLQREGFADVSWGDLADPAAVARLPLRKFDVVTHLAGASSGSPEQLERANVLATERLARWAFRSGTPRLIFASTAAVYADRDDLAPCEETSRPDPSTPYARSKLSAERRLADYARQAKLRVVTLRFPHVYGPGKRVGVLWSLIEQLRQGERVVLDGEGEVLRDFLYVADAVEALQAAVAMNGSQSFEVFNIGSGRSYTLRALAALLGRAMGRSPRIESSGRRPDPPRYMRLDVGKARRMLGWTARTGLEEGVGRLLQSLNPS